MNIDIPRRFGASLGRLRAWVLGGLFLLLSCGALADRVLDFNYSLARGSAPVARVYDDGHRTYLVIDEEASTDALWEMARTATVRRNGEVLSVPVDRSRPHPSIAGVYDRIAVGFGRRQAVATYNDPRWQPAPWEDQAEGKPPVIQLEEKVSATKVPAEEMPADRAEEAEAPEKAWAAVTLPEKPPAIREEPMAAPREETAMVAKVQERPEIAETVRQPPAPVAAPLSQKAEEALPARELPDNQVVRVAARSGEAPIAAPVALPAARAASAAPNGDGNAGEEEKDDVAEYKVMIPFALGKIALGKEGEKAMAEVAQIGPIAREIRIRVPGDSGRDFLRAYSRAAEIHRQLVKAGLVRQHVSIEIVDAVPEGKLVRAEVALIVDLTQTAAK